MTNRERVIASINFEKPDKVPHNVFFTEQAFHKMQQHSGNNNYIQSIQNHITQAYLDKAQVQVAPDRFRDEFGVIWDKSGADKDIGVVSNIQIADEESFANYVFPPVDEQYIRQAMRALEASDDSNFKVASIGFSLFERAWTLMGFENTLCNMCAEPELLHKVLRKICDRNLQILDIALEYDFDCFHFGDDWGQQQGLIMGVTHWNEFIRPYLEEMYTKVKKRGLYISQHSCGDLRDILDTLWEMGLNIDQTFQPEIYGLEYAKKLHGKIAVWGGISTQRDLPYKSPQEIRQIVKNTIRAFGGTGLIVSPTHAIEFDVPAENIDAMIHEFIDQRSE